MAESAPTLYDHTGRRVSMAALRRDHLRPDRANAMAGSRGLWYQSLYRFVNPTTLGQILYESRIGTNLDRFLSLAEELEEVDTHYSGVLRARKRATTKLPLTIEPNGAGAEIATACEKLIQEPDIQAALMDVLDALGKGYSCSEIMWHTTASGWEPRAVVWRDPHFFTFDRADRKTIMLRTDLTHEEPLPPFKFVYHQPKLKSGLPVRNGLARLCAWVWLYKHFTLRDWMQFMEVFGMPLRVGKYQHGAPQDDIDVLREQVRALGHDASAVIPNAMDIEFVQLTNAGGQGGIFEKAAKYFDQALSKAIIGQTMTTDTGGSLAQAKVHMEVAHDLTESDARELARTLSRDLVMPFVQLNWGPQERYPLARFEIPERPGENVDADGDGGEGGQGGGAELNRSRLRQSANAVDAETETALVSLAGEYLGGWRAQMGPLREGLDALLDNATSIEEARARLPGLMRTWGETDHALIDALGESMFLADGMGNDGEGE